MAKDEIVQYNIRLNLNNPNHLRLHQAILNANMEIYKSKNNYLRKVAYRGIFGECENLDEENDIVDLSQLVTKKELEEQVKKIKESVMQEMLGMMFSFMAGKTPMISAIPRVEEPEEDTVDDAVADAALGYF